MKAVFQQVRKVKIFIKNHINFLETFLQGTLAGVGNKGVFGRTLPEKAQGGALLDDVEGFTGDQLFWYLVGEGLRHVLGPDVGDALHGQAHVHWVARLKVVLDRLVDQVDQLAVLTDQNGDEQVTL